MKKTILIILMLILSSFVLASNIQLQEQNNNRFQLRTGNQTAETNLVMTQTQTQLRARVSNGETKDINYDPEQASERIRQRVRLEECSEETQCKIELKEVNNEVVYELNAVEERKILGLFRVNTRLQAQLNAETGTIERVRNSWWAFLT